METKMETEMTVGPEDTDTEWWQEEADGDISDDTGDSDNYKFTTTVTSTDGNDGDKDYQQQNQWIHL